MHENLQGLLCMNSWGGGNIILPEKAFCLDKLLQYKLSVLKSSYGWQNFLLQNAA